MNRNIFLSAAFFLIAFSPVLVPQQSAASAAAASETQSGQFPNAKIDAKAKAALDAMRAVYSAAKSFRGDVALRTSGFADRPRFDLSVKFLRDNKLALRNISETGEENIVSDGAVLIDTNSLHKGMYLRVAAPKSTALLKAAFGQISAQNTVLFRLLSKSNVLSAFGTSLRTVRVGTADDAKRARELAGAIGVSLSDAKDEEIIICEYSRGKNSGTVFYILDKTDRLLRASVAEQKIGAKTMTVVETHANAALDAPLSAADFLVEPPLGAQLVNEFPKPGYDPRLKIGGEPFELSGNDIDGKPISLSDLKGKVVLIDFWASWCPPCREEAPEVARLYEDNKDSGFEVLGVSLDQNASTARAFAQASGMTWRHLLDGDASDIEYSRLYGVASIPFTMLIGADGKIAAIGPRGQMLTRRVQQALSGERADRTDLR